MTKSTTTQVDVYPSLGSSNSLSGTLETIEGLLAPFPTSITHRSTPNPSLGEAAQGLSIYYVDKTLSRVEFESLIGDVQCTFPKAKTLELYTPATKDGEAQIPGDWNPKLKQVSIRLRNEI